jgi:hypothetical protein
LPHRQKADNYEYSNSKRDVHGEFGAGIFPESAVLCYKVRKSESGVFHLMPPRRTWLKCSPVFTLIAVVFLVPAGVKAQTGRVTMQANVSETVALSVAPNFTHGNVDAEVMTSGNTVRITSQAPVIRVPLLVRSNSSFKISATVESSRSLTQISIADVRATGTLVSPAALSGLTVPEQFDLETSRDLLLVSGPRVSLGGTLNSANNALQITVLIYLQPQTAPGSSVQLTFAAAPLSQ